MIFDEKKAKELLETAEQAMHSLPNEYPYNAFHGMANTIRAFLDSPMIEKEPYLCKDCGCPLVGNYVTGHFHCTDVHPDDR